MSFAGAHISVIGLAKIELPARTIRLCDGGFAYFGGEKYVARDSVFGAIAGIEPIEEQLGDLAPGGKLVFLPPDGADLDVLLSPAYQFSRMRFWIGEIGGDGKTVSHAELLADVLIDTMTLRLSKSSIALDVDYISRADKLFSIAEGNVLSTRFHSSVWAGEQGFDNANGLQRNVAWGTENPSRAQATFVGGGVGGGAGGRFNDNGYEP